MDYHNKQQFITWLTFYWAGTELNTHNYGQFTDDDLTSYVQCCQNESYGHWQVLLICISRVVILYI